MTRLDSPRLVQYGGLAASALLAGLVLGLVLTPFDGPDLRAANAQVAQLADHRLVGRRGRVLALPVDRNPVRDRLRDADQLRFLFRIHASGARAEAGPA